MIRTMTAQLLLLQCPVVLFLIVASFQAVTAFRAKGFYLIAGGWLVNLFYLTTNLTSTPVLLSFLGTLSDLLRFLTCALFWYAAHKFGRENRLLYLKNLRDSTFIAFLIVIFIASQLFHKFLLHTSALPILYKLPDVLFSIIGILALATYFNETAGNIQLSSTRHGRLIYISTIYYAAIQPIEFFNVQSTTILIDIQVFSNLIVKIFIFFGMIRLFVAYAQAFTISAAEQKVVREQARVLSDLAHELGTPIGEILTWVDGLLRSNKSGDFSRKLEMIASAASRAVAIVHASRFVIIPPAADEALVKPQVVSANTLVEIAQNTVKRTRSETVTYFRQYSASCCLECIPIEIVQILTNLLRNSYDALTGPRGRITIKTIAVEQFTHEGVLARYVKIILRDNGEGIRGEDIGQIFNKGYSTRAGLHRGQGLTISKQLAEKNQGTIEIYSPPMYMFAEDSPGTEVVLTFPRVPCSLRN